MATLLLRSAGAAIGTALGGPIGGLIGGAIGAVGGAVVDSLLVNTLTHRKTRAAPPQADAIAITNATEGANVRKLWGRMRLGGNVIWCTGFSSTTTTEKTKSSSGKGFGGGGASTTTTTVHYTLSFAVAFCEGGDAVQLGRVWADGNPLDLGQIAYTFYNGSDTQLPDAFMEAVEGTGNVPAYRGIAYLVFPNLALDAFGNRMPQITAVAVLSASNDATVSKNKYASRASNYDTSYALDVWSKTPGPGGAGMSVACSSAGALINGLPSLQLPDLVVFCWGINDVRSGNTTQGQLVARITQAVNRIRAVLPTTDIVLWGPNSFLADDPTGAALITPNTNAAVLAASAQAYSTLLYSAYEQLKNVWPNVLVLQKQDIFGKTSLAQAVLTAGGAGQSSMSDQLHPTNGAQTQMADWLAPLIGFKKPFNLQRANLARLSNPTASYVVYPREVEDPAFYDVVAQAAWLGQGNVSGNDYMDILLPGPRYKEILPGDIVQMGSGGAVFPVPLSGVTLYNLNASTTRFGFTGTGLLPSFSGGTVTVYRHKFEWDATVQSYRQQLNAYPYARRFFCPAAGAGYLRLYPLAQNMRDPANALINPGTDVIVGAGGFGAITGYSTLSFAGTANWQISKTGTDFTALKNTYVWVFSTTPAREQIENVFEPIRLNASGSVANSAYVRSVACRGAGKVNRLFYQQKTAGSTDMTIVLAVAGVTVLTLLVTASHTQVQTTTWATPSAFSVFPGQLIEWTLTGGAGAADVAIALDIGG